MKDTSCINFLQWALPLLNMRWRGFRKVRRQVCRRIDKRISALNLDTIEQYRKYLEVHPDEWNVLDGLCRVTISRFYRDRVVFDYFIVEVMPALIRRFRSENRKNLRIWSAGCASGEEPYTVALLWHFLFRQHYPDIKISILATDADPVMIRRAQTACYSINSLRELPDNWIATVFNKKDGLYCLQEQIKKTVQFEIQDIRKENPGEQYHVVLCRNLAFTYFDREVQQRILQRISTTLAGEGILIIGRHETPAPEWVDLTQCVEHMPIYKKQ